MGTYVQPRLLSNLLIYSKFPPTSPPPSCTDAGAIMKMQAESQNADHRWVCLWSLRSSRLDHRFYPLLCEAEETETSR